MKRWRFEFFGWDCPILKIETPWFDIVFDGRVELISKARDLEE